ncbi:thioesterase [Paenibacillus sp. J45TS6]|uniref:DRTGG domain-containing protein n=1 Tax=Paenibacillus sp. J45TS6 TaxID=2807196 RepID=UPI001B138EBF|nr:DRTGG domain-containing protein [Paenibacillus sp. J45TS6]GIP43257.1 thioesterase [Paenibacillus sp. J45TS6]
MEGNEETVTKHVQLLEYIRQLKIGTKISVRGLAKELGVSEGTAYRAVKEAENAGLVVTRERVGTIRVEKRLRGASEQLTFGDVVEIVEGYVLGGREGLSKPLHKYVIGAMKEEAMAKYIDADSLLIVGNRDNAHLLALNQGAGVLITGGFETSSEVIQLANELSLPIISSRHDTFTVASMINRAIFDRLIKKKIMLLEDIVGDKPRSYYLKLSSTVSDFSRLVLETGELRFPVIDEWNRVIGIITRKDVIELDQNEVIEKCVVRKPVTATLKTSLASAAQLMASEGIDYLPIVDRNRKLITSVKRREVLDAMREAQKQPQLGETFDHLIWNGFVEERGPEGDTRYNGIIIPQMATDLGTISEGVLVNLMTQAGYKAAQEKTGSDHVLENITTYFVRPVQIEDKISIVPRILEVSRLNCKLDIDIIHEDHKLICKAIMTLQAIDRV